MLMILRFYKFLFFFLVIAQSAQICATDKVQLYKNIPDDQIIIFLNQQDQREFLIKIIKTAYLRDKGEKEILAKLLSHTYSQQVVDGWKKFEKTNPTSIKSSYWKNMLQRGSLVLFTESNPTSKIDSVLDNPTTIKVTRMGGTASNTIVIEAIWDLKSKIGEKYVDDTHGDNVGREKAGATYSQKDLTQIKVLCDITSLIKAIHTNGTLPQDVSEFISLKSIFPTD